MARKRKAKLVLTKHEALVMLGILSRVGSSKAVGPVTLKVSPELRSKIWSIQWDLSQQVDEQFPEDWNLYEITGGYVGEDIWVTPDGYMYEN